MKKNFLLGAVIPLVIFASFAAGVYYASKPRLSSSSDWELAGLDLFRSNKLTQLIDIIDAQYVDSVDVNDLIDYAIPEILNQLDPHSVYISTDEVQAAMDDMKSTFSGIGVSFNMQTDTILVIDVISGGPAEKAGLMPFDRIITINDSTFSGQNISQNDIMKNLKGPDASHVKLGILRGDNSDLIYFDVTRGQISVNSIDAAYMLEGGEAYIKIGKFAATTYDELVTAIARLRTNNKDPKGYIIDLRDNGGGLLDEAINIINEFMPDGKLLVYTEGLNASRIEAYSNGNGLCQEYPLVLLTNESSASASEIFAGAVQDNDRGLVIGRRTFGKGLVQSQIPLYDGSVVRLTISRYHTASGRCIQKEYEKGNSDKYDEDIYNRFLHGEFDNVDSIKANTDQLFKTSIGRTVYGGGGVMPDIFIPRDTTELTPYFIKLYDAGLIYRFAIEQSEERRDIYSAVETWQDLDKLLKKEKLVERLTNYAANKGIKKRPYYIDISTPLLERQLRAYIVRNFFGDEGFYYIIQEDDEAIQKAIEVIDNGSWKPTLDEQNTAL